MSQIDTRIFDDSKEELGEKDIEVMEGEVASLPDLTVFGKIRKIRRYMREQMSMRRFHLTIISLVGIDLIIVMVELIVGKFFFLNFFSQLQFFQLMLL